MNEKKVLPENIKLENRIDIFIKIIYARYREYGVSSTWPRRLYLEHIKIFNRFFEQDGSGKCGQDAFTNTFDDILDSIKNIGFSQEKEPVVIGSDSTPITGAHRVAACVFYDVALNTVQKDYVGPEYNYNYFRNIGLPDKYIEPAVIEYCQSNLDAFLVFLYPSGVGKKEEAHALLETAGDIFYQKDILLTKTGQVRFMRQAYSTEPWLGSWKDNFSGAKHKARHCFSKEGSVKVYVVKSNVDKLLEVKLKIRDLYDVENHSIHTTDFHEETVRLAQQLFNDNSLRFLNTATDKVCTKYERLISIYKDWLSTHNFNADDYCIDGSGILSAYGIRDARDIDYVHLGDEPLECDHSDVGNHNSELRYHPLSKDEMIVDPQYHFYYDGVKYISLAVIREMKVKRAEPKDKIDVQLIDNFLAGKKEPLSLLFKRKLTQLSTKAYYTAKLRGLKMSLDMLRYKLIKK